MVKSVDRQQSLYLALFLKKSPAIVDHCGYNKLLCFPSQCGGEVMVRDAVANAGDQRRCRAYTPRKVGQDSWESRCPAHRSSDYALSITRNDLNHVVLECRSTENCQHIRIVRALGFTNEHVYADTSDWLISRLNRVEIQPAWSESSDATPKSGRRFEPRPNVESHCCTVPLRPLTPSLSPSWRGR